MGRAYLWRHLFDGDRLRDRALEEFAAAMRTGRLVAFVGSFATVKLNYRSWKSFLKKYASIAGTVIENRGIDIGSRKSPAIKAIKDVAACLGKDAPTGLSIIEHALAYVSEPGENLDLDLQRAGADLFKLTNIPSARMTHPRRLVEKLGIRRIITLNYDLEFEWELMTTAEEKLLADAPRSNRHKIFQSLEKEVDPDTFSIVRTLPSGRSVISDVFLRQRPDRLLEFAVGSPDFEANILHLHGRMTNPETMLISQSDYNQQYRRSGVSKLPFEHALRILFAGNPILFVGTGMTEIEVTSSLEQFVSDFPNRRSAPTFIIWNSPADEAQKNGIRFKWLHRFGALTLFDDEIADGPRSAASDAQLRLGQSIENLAVRAVEQMARYDWRDEQLRSSQWKLDNRAKQEEGRFDVWSQDLPDPTELDEDLATEVVGALTSPSLIHLFIGEPGTGKGRLARQIRKIWEDLPSTGVRRSSIINASFVFEIDSIFGLISGLGDGMTAKKEARSRSESLEAYVKAGNEEVDLLLVINGMERFFTPEGVPLSAELDSLLRLLSRMWVQFHDQLPSSLNSVDARSEGDAVKRKPYEIVILGTERVRRYFEGFENAHNAELVADHKALAAKLLASPPDAHRSHYLDSVRDAFARRSFPPSALSPAQAGRIQQVVDSGPGAARRAMFSAYLQPEALKAANVKFPDLCLDLLTAMAFIGQPIEDAALIHTPRVKRRLDKIVRDWRSVRREDVFAASLLDLKDLNLVLELRCYEGSPPHWKRYGLHRSILAELRDRWGVPLSDSQLSTGFNISLLAAQPTDGYTPEQDIHDDLGVLVDWLIGAHKDQPIGGYDEIEDRGPYRRWNEAADRAAIKLAMVKPAGSNPKEDPRRAWPHVSSSLRAAVALIRSYYSTSSLLTIDGGKPGNLPNRDGPLTQHADRLDRLLKAAVANASARTTAERRLGPKAHWVGPAPLYGDDLVWLYNEKGIVYLAQGDLYEARAAFDEALRINRDHVEFASRGQNWRRIMLNQVVVDIERGSLDRAESRLNRIQESIEFPETRGESRSLQDHVTFTYCQPAGKRMAREPTILQEEVLTIALIIGYRGLCMHLKGQLQTARSSFEAATTILGKLGERRAYAQFQRYLASLLPSMSEPEDAAKARQLALAAAEATRQFDIAFQARLSQAWHSDWRTNLATRAAAVREMQDALTFAENNDMYRLRIEAGANLANLKFAGGDYDAALAHAADALATATRYGLSLRKITLRILMGRILMRRGDPTSGRALIDRATRTANRINYQRAVEAAQNVLDAEAHVAA